MKNYVLEARNLTKSFPGVLALDKVDIELHSHEIHGVIGENGAGKSTLVKCLTGLYIPTSGEILLNNKQADKAELNENVAYVPQEINLFDNLTVGENLFMPFGTEYIINNSEINKQAYEILDKFSLDVSPETYVKDITVSQKQLLQIARATQSMNYDVLILDEPTTSLTKSDMEHFYAIVRELKEQGKSIIFISHKFEELFDLCDVISVFRNGKKIAYHRINEVNVSQIIREMSGKEIDTSTNYRSSKVTEETVLSVDNLSGEHFNNVNFSLSKGEILGFAGLVGAGRSELMQAIFGYRPCFSGEVILDKENITNNTTIKSVKQGLIYIPEERKTQGILANLSVKDNIMVALLDNITKNGVINDKEANKIIDEIIETYSVKTPSTDQEIQFLSGGNQQKIIIGRGMYTNPKVIIFDEPTKGIDVGTKEDIYQLMKDLAENKGIGIILISSEIEEILKCSNRVIAMSEGHLIKEFNHPFKQENLLEAMLGESEESNNENKQG